MFVFLFFISYLISNVFILALTICFRIFIDFPKPSCCRAEQLFLNCIRATNGFSIASCTYVFTQQKALEKLYLAPLLLWHNSLLLSTTTRGLREICGILYLFAGSVITWQLVSTQKCSNNKNKNDQCLNKKNILIYFSKQNNNYKSCETIP